MEGVTEINTTRKGATFSRCRRYRYRLWRRWQDGPTLVAIGLNPSTADAEKDDPTIRRLMGFARRWECGGLIVLNLLAFRATSPATMKAAPLDPVGDANWHAFDGVLPPPRRADIVLCCWGAGGAHMDRDRTVTAYLEHHGITPWCLGVTSVGLPRHPLYVPYAATRRRYQGRQEDAG